MSINLDIVIATNDESVDMKAGLTSMQGVSDAVRCIAESVLTEKVPERQTSKSSVRTSLKKSFKGSYGHIFTLDVYDDELQKKLNKIGKVTFIELISYFISESLYREPGQLTDKAHKIIDKLGETTDQIVEQLRTSALKNIHDVSVKFNHDVRIRHRISRDQQIVIASFDEKSAKVLQAKQSDKQIRLNVVITRLNIHTGNGRLQIEGENETIAFGFGFGAAYRELSVKAKKIFSENLNHNNGIAQEKWKYLTVVASPIETQDGRIIKYIMKSFHEN